MTTIRRYIETSSSQTNFESSSYKNHHCRITFNHSCFNSFLIVLDVTTISHYIESLHYQPPNHERQQQAYTYYISPKTIFSITYVGCVIYSTDSPSACSSATHMGMFFLFCLVRHCLYKRLASKAQRLPTTTNQRLLYIIQEKSSITFIGCVVYKADSPSKAC